MRDQVLTPGEVLYEALRGELYRIPWIGVRPFERKAYERAALSFMGRVDTNLDLVRAFHTAFEVPMLGEPAFPSPERIDLRLRILDEERNELGEAITDHDLVEVADALTDMAYVVYGTALEFGIDLNACFREVHRSNMSKLGDDGRPIFRRDGKVLKGPNYSPPALAAMLAAHETAVDAGREEGE